MGRILGFDYGKARIGIAVSDERKIIASPLLTVEAEHLDVESARKILPQVSRLAPFDRLVVGLPLLLNGKEGEMAMQAKKFAKYLEQVFNVPVVFWDERLTSSQVERLLKECSQKRKDRAKSSDTLAATVILQNYLDAHGHN